MAPQPVPRLESIRVRNYRALRDLKLAPIQPFTVLVGPNGSGKSTVFDVFAFLSECFEGGLRRALDRRGKLAELRTRDQSGPLEFEIRYREAPGLSPITYRLSIDEDASGPVVAEEVLQWSRRGRGRPFQFLVFARGEGQVVSGETPDVDAERIHERLDAPDMLAVSALGQFARHPRVSALRRFITGWYLSYITAESTRGNAEAGPQERLSRTGDNLPNVIQFLQERHSERLETIFHVLRDRVPRLSHVSTDPLPDGRLLLRLHDAPFSTPILARFASDGTMKMLAYLLVLYDPEPPQLIGIEEPENHLHPRLLQELAEECRAAAQRSQVLVTSHSQSLVDALRPQELFVLQRDAKGHTRATCARDITGVTELVAEGAALGDVWREGYLERPVPGPRKQAESH